MRVHVSYVLAMDKYLNDIKIINARLCNIETFFCLKGTFHGQNKNDTDNEGNCTHEANRCGRYEEDPEDKSKRIWNKKR